MTTFVLVPGADGTAWYWHLLVPELRAHGHRAVTPDLPSEEGAGLVDFADAVVAAVEASPPDAGDPLVVVAQSLGGFSAPLVCDRLPVEEIVLLNAMVPVHGESAGEWWVNTGQAAARSAYAEEIGRGPDPEFDPLAEFFHDVPPEVAEQAMAAEPRPVPSTFFADPWPLERWPAVPTRFLQGREDRLFPLEFQRRVVRERLGIEVEEIPGGHVPALGHPKELAAALLRS
ncbi:alpha/beta fold hydrolase [Streptomyces sp. CA-111067]|uniref:alpha/beta fold hydrolase n=1 Tax=Streptomyces sp. CA-111067 TaxID=3240046 RepID=UPI003D994986